MVSIYFPIRQYDNILGDSLNLLESCTLSQSALSRVTLVLQGNAEHTVQYVHNEQYNYNFKDEQKLTQTGCSVSWITQRNKFQELTVFILKLL